MRKFYLAICFMLLNVWANAGAEFGKYFKDQTIRIDYYHSGDAYREIISLDKMYRIGRWAGNTTSCIQEHQLGEYRINLYAKDTDSLIYSKGYTTIFFEYQTTQPALDSINRTYHESIYVPEPKKEVLCRILKKEKDRLYHPLFEFVLDPKDYHIVNENNIQTDCKIIRKLENGDIHDHVDLVIVGEGYTRKNLKKFKKDLEYYTNSLFSVEPFKSRQQQFNVTGIMPYSEEEGTDEPRKGIYRNTALNSSFNIFDTERYILVEDNKTLQDVVCQVPFDALLILVNHERYGGGGIYNCQALFTSGERLKDFVFIHEFGHAFAGLADEYFSSDVSYVDFYPPGVEPAEANITALLDPENVKWKDLLSPGLEVPTDWDKEIYDSLSLVLTDLYLEKNDTLTALKAAAVDPEQFKKVEAEYDQKIKKVKKETDDFMFNHPLRDKIGVFEGAGYASTGLYRPTIYSIMHRFNVGDKTFKEVNEKAIIEVIDFYTKN